MQDAPSSALCRSLAKIPLRCGMRQMPVVVRPSNELRSSVRDEGHLHRKLPVEKSELVSTEGNRMRHFSHSASAMRGRRCADTQSHSRAEAWESAESRQPR